MKTRIALIILMMAFCWESFAQTAQLIENQTVNLTFTALDGRKIDLSSYAGKVVLIDCWATWCGPCLKEMPHIKSLHDKYKKQGFEVIGISMDEEIARGRAKKFLLNAHISWPQRFEGKGFASDTFSQAYQLKSLPTVFLLDREGRIVNRDARGEKLEALLKKYLGNL